MPKFTPGPWKLFPGTYEWGKQLKICTVDRNNPMYILIGGPNKENDAQFLSASPNLYEAAKDALEFIETLEDYWPHSQNRNNELIEKLASALTLADGEERIL